MTDASLLDLHLSSKDVTSNGRFYTEISVFNFNFASLLQDIVMSETTIKISIYEHIKS